MAKFRVLKRFKDKETKEVHEVSQGDETIEMTVKRATEINRNLKEYGEILERVEEVEEKTEAESEE